MNVGVAWRLLAVMVLWASCFPLITTGLGFAPPLAFAAMRATLAGLCLLAMGATLGRPMPKGKRTWALILAVGIGTTTFGFFGMFHAAEFISPGLATVIANAQPLLAAVLAYAFLGERLKLIGAAGLVVGFLGIIAIAWPGLSSDEVRGYTLGLVYILFAAVGLAIGNIAMKRLAGSVDAVVVTGLQLLLGAVPLALLSIALEDISAVSLSVEFLVILTVLSVFGTAFAFWQWFAVLRQVSLNQANAFTFLVPIFGLGIAAAFFQEKLEPVQAVGVALSLGGIALVGFGAVQTRAPMRGEEPRLN
jgi:drug/metabolite transporter (DMT)-like permease